MRLVRGHTLEFHCRPVNGSRGGSIFRSKDIIIFRILHRFNCIRLVLIFVGALADKGHLIENFALY